MEPFSALISAGANLLGGLLGKQSQDKQQAANLAQQVDFAKHGLGWKIEDAVAHGLSPLVGAGAQPGPSFSNIVGDNSMGAGVAAAGQDLGRAAGALAKPDDKLAIMNETLLGLKIKQAEAEITHQQLVNSQMATRLAQPATGPGVKVPLPREDPRGPVIPLVQRAWDYRTGEIVNIPSEKAASPLQTLAASPTNIALSGRALTEGLMGFDEPSVRPDVRRRVLPVENYYYSPF